MFLLLNYFRLFICWTSSFHKKNTILFLPYIINHLLKIRIPIFRHLTLKIPVCFTGQTDLPINFDNHSYFNKLNLLKDFSSLTIVFSGIVVTVAIKELSICRAKQLLAISLHIKSFPFLIPFSRLSFFSS